MTHTADNTDRQETTAMSRFDSAREIAIETAALAMGGAQQDGAAGLGLRQRRELAALAYRAIATSLAREIRAEGDRIAETSRTVHAFAQAEGLRAAAVFALSSVGGTTTSGEEQA